MKPIRIGTRGSQLALWQANEVSRKLLAAGYQSEVRVIRTTGDRRHDVPLATIGGKGLFVKEIEEALDAGDVDIAVHSLKDVPSLIPEQFVLAAFLERADPRDAWIQLDGKLIHDLPANARIGTSSPRRRAQLLRLRRDLEVENMRGNVDTRISKLSAGDYDAMILACAGLRRLGREQEITSLFPVDEMVPAAGQGIVGIEILRDRSDALSAPLEAIDDRDGHLAAVCERGVLQKFGTILDCYSSIAVHATIDDGRITIDTFLSDPSGQRAIRDHRSGPVQEREQLVADVAQYLRDEGALELLEVQPAH